MGLLLPVGDVIGLCRSEIEGDFSLVAVVDYLIVMQFLFGEDQLLFGLLVDIVLLIDVVV